VLQDVSLVRERHETIQAAEAARTHAKWFDRYSDLYGSRTAELIGRGRGIPPAALEAALAERDRFRDALRRRMRDDGIDAWIAPSSVGPAPRGLDSTGDPVMNLPWTHAGLPVINLPAGAHRNGLPLGLQIVGQWQQDEDLLLGALEMERVMRRL
jgi:Asp-tRNA(Asn)/Glu-tRNA(Gln) amidotransferase A subunit family amidase